MILSKETSLFQHDKIKNIADNADNAKHVAIDYVTDVTSGGVFIHRNDDDKNGSVPTASNAYGVHIDDDVDIIRGGRSIAMYGETARIGEEDGARLELSSVELTATNSDGIEGFKVELDAPGLVAYPKISSSIYSHSSPVTVSFYAEPDSGSVLYGGADIEIGWKEKPIPPDYSSISQIVPWLRGDYAIQSIDWSSSDGWSYSESYSSEPWATTCKVMVPFSTSNSLYRENSAYRFIFGTPKTVGITGVIHHVYEEAPDTTVTAIVSYDGDSTITVSATTNSSDYFDFIKVPYISYMTTTEYSTAITAGYRSGNTGSFSAIFGQGLYAEDTASVAFGTYNYGSTPEGNTAVLTIGDGGSDDDRSNVFTIGADGEIYISLPGWDEQTGTDKMIYDALTTLSWDDCLIDWDRGD